MRSFSRFTGKKGRIEAKPYWQLGELGGMTRNQHLLGKINSGQVDPRLRITYPL